MEPLSRIIVLLVISSGALAQYSPSPRFGYISIGPCSALSENAECSMSNVKFYLYTSVNPEDPEIVNALPGYSNLSLSTFNSANPTKIIIHGYNSGINLDALIDIKDAYLSTKDHNVFLVEWSSISQAPCYPIAAHNARYVGRCISELIKAIAAESSQGQARVPDDLHLIGFSLGAQVAGFVANHLSPLVVPRITGLDPAMPLFLTPNTEKKLDASDADFVDVIHTNALMQGQLQATGHLDFYLNGGFKQPGCEFTQSPTACSHHRAAYYFAESIVSEFGFWGWPCDSWFSYLLGSCTRQRPVLLMGEFADPTSRGVYYVDTDSTPPFALGRDEN